MRLQVRHLHRGGLHPGKGHADLLLARHQRTGDVRKVQRLKLFRGKQPQRPQIQALPGALQPLDSFVGLAGIGRPQVKIEMPAHLPCQRIQVPVVFRDRVQQRGTDASFSFVGCVRLFLQADQRRVLFQQPPEPFPGKLFLQRVKDQPAFPLRFPADGGRHGLPARQAHGPARAQFRELFRRLSPQETVQ